MDLTPFLIKSGSKFRLNHYDPAFHGDYKSKEDAGDKLNKDLGKLAGLQDVLYAQDIHAVLVVLQAMDTAGKDGLVKHVMSGMNPAGVQVTSFKAPSAEELDHDYLWRSARALPERGKIGIFNRSYFEEVLVVRVRPDLLAREKLPPEALQHLWRHRYEDINAFERYLTRNGIQILKLFLHLSKEEQKKRLMDRLDRSEKNWKFSDADLETRARWDDYQDAYEKMLENTSTPWAPWHVLPADHKWFTRLVAAELLVRKLESLGLEYPKVGKEGKKRFNEFRRRLAKD